MTRREFERRIVGRSESFEMPPSGNLVSHSLAKNAIEMGMFRPPTMGNITTSTFLAPTTTENTGASLKLTFRVPATTNNMESIRVTKGPMLKAVASAVAAGSTGDEIAQTDRITPGREIANQSIETQEKLKCFLSLYSSRSRIGEINVKGGGGGAG